VFKPAPQPDQRALLFLFITVLLSMVGLGIVIPVMPALIQDLTGASVSRASELNGWLLTVFAITQFFMSPILGALSDRFGRRPVILLSLLSYALDFLLMAIAPTYAWLFIGRMLSGACAATFATANAFIADISPPEKRAGNFGILGAAFGLGFIVGPVLGGLVGELGPRWPFVVASLVTFANLVFGYFVFPETVSAENRRAFDWRRANPIGGLLSVGRHPLVLGVLSAYFLMQFAHNSLPAIWSFFTKEKFAWSEWQIGVSLAYVGITAAFVQGYLTRRIIPKIGETRAVLIGMAGMTASFLGYAFATPSGAWVFLWITVGAIGGFLMPGMQGIMSRATPSNEQGELQGAIASVMSLTLASSPYTMSHVFGAYTDRTGDIYFPGAPWLLSAILLAASAIPFALTMRKVPPRSAVADTEVPAR
jgi:DHA1 family tetracycline resistance protein-like MFS transporter